MSEDVGEALIRVRSLSKQFSHRPVLSNVSFDIHAGDIFGIIGVSGSGKTTLLQLLIGYLQPDSGEILYHQGSSDDSIDPQYVPVASEPSAARRRFGFSAQEPSFYHELTVAENLSYFGSLYNLSGEKLQKNIGYAITMLSLQNEAETIAGELSGGMQKRLDIAVSLIHGPRVLILDEPTADLDIASRRQIWAMLKKINAAGTTVIIASHFLEEMEHLCTTIAILHNHHVVEKGDVAGLKRLLYQGQEVHLELRSRNYEKLKKSLALQNIPIGTIREADGVLIAQSPEAEHLLQSIIHLVEQQKEEVVDVSLQRPTLNDVFETMIR
ncbi:ABC transporter ATP-binding protein [Candidatus Woesearchaeota archaeon]|nr:ABC transporter ATP-binding protein [Candidatus Woesearchaeota archaeon]